jgi:DNA polymerase-3 subunit alpha (Gram-positive type)
MDTVRAKLRELTSKSDLSKVEEDMLVSLEACYEFYLRGFKFAPIDLYTSHANRFTILDDKTLLPPFNSVNGLGDSAAADIVEKRVGVTFVSVDDFASICTKVTKAHIEGLRAVGAFDGLPESAQLSLF